MKQEKPAALITGGAKRLGRAMAFNLASRGYDIAIHYRHSREEAEEVISVVESFGQQCHLFQADLFQTHAARTLLQEVKATFSHLSLLINNASIFYPQGFLESSEEEFDQFFNIHVKTPYFLVQDFARLCGKGHIINMLDADIGEHKISYFPYILSKKSLTDLTLLAAKALGPDIRVNAVAPGYIIPPVEGNEDPQESHARKVPLKRLGNVEEINRGVNALLDMPYVTGQIIYVDGGQHLLT